MERHETPLEAQFPGEGYGLVQYDKHNIVSMVKEDGTPATFTTNNNVEYDTEDRKNFQRIMSHSGTITAESQQNLTNPDGGILLGAQILTGVDASTGTLTAMIEASTVDGDEIATEYKKGIIRYDQTVEVKAQIFAGDLSR